MLTVAVLGPVEVRRDGRLLPVPAGKSTEVLVRLAVDAGRLVRTERIIDDLWGADAVVTGRNTLQSKVSQLRRALGDPAAILGVSGGYSLEIEPAAVDVARVVDLAAESASFRAAGDGSSCLRVAGEALALFRGEAFVDAGDAAWLDVHRVRIEEVRLGLVEDRLAARDLLGAGPDLIAELEALVQEHPLREGLWVLLVRALYRSGRQADALAAYRRVREALVESLGIEPGPALREVESQILDQSPDLDAVVTGGAVVAGGAAGNLPTRGAALVGRDADLATLGALVSGHPLVTVVGPAGVGKTQLAIEAGRRLPAPGGVWLVRLEAADETSTLESLVADAFGLAGDPNAVADRLGAAPTVVILDNCEHVVDAAGSLAEQLLAISPSVRILATSQLPLGLDGEVVRSLDPLADADSVDLFAARAGATRRGFRLDDDTRDLVAEVCRSLDGLPLAIELAAARVASLSVHEIARRLDDRFALLRDPTSRRPERRRALAGAIAWSYDLLFPDDQRGLWALAGFVDGAPLDAAEHVLEALDVPRASAIDVIGRLVDRSLVGVDIADDGAVRYRLLDSIRAFAYERSIDAGVAADVRRAHAAWFAAAADRCATDVRGPGQPACLALVRAERANIDAALAWCADHDRASGLRIAAGFAWTWVVLGDGAAGAARLRTVLDRLDRLDRLDDRDDLGSLDRLDDPAGAARAGLITGWLEASAGDVVRAAADIATATAIARRLDDPLLTADVDRHRAFLHIQEGRAAEVVEAAARSLDHYRAANRPWESAGSLLLWVFGALMSGDIAAAERLAGEALVLLDPLGDSWGMVHAQAMLGAIAQADHRFDDAATALSAAAAESERLGFSGQAALHLTSLGRVEQRAGRPDDAVATLGRAIDAALLVGDPRVAATARLTLARVLRSMGSTDEAVATLRLNERWYGESGGGDGALLTRALLAAADGSTDDLVAVLAEARSADAVEVEVTVLDGLARVAAIGGDHATAADLLGRSDSLALTVAHDLDDADRVDAIEARALTPAS